jgi:hypothetical protein
MKKYEQVIVIGYGVIAGDILKTVCQYAVDFDYNIIYIEHEVQPFSSAKKFAKANKIETEVIEDKDELIAYFHKKIGGGKRTLIISAGNNYIFRQNWLVRVILQL